MRRRHESRLRQCYRSACEAGGLLDWLLVAALAAGMGWTLAGGPL